MFVKSSHLTGWSARHRPLRLLLAPLCLAGVLSLPPCGGLSAQTEGTRVEPAEQREVVERAIALLEERYVFPGSVVTVVDSLRSDLATGAYGTGPDAGAFAEALSARIRGLSGDGHLWVAYEPTPSNDAGVAEREAPEERGLRLARSNFGFPRVEVLPGNVGYLDIRTFVEPALAGDAVASAMGFLGGVEALILDVRRSQGGSPAMVALLASYVVHPKPVHLFDLYMRSADRTDQYWTLSYLPGPRLADRPVYVLTAGRTFSAGEGLAYLLKHIGRAEVVGERTGGGANPGAFHRLSDRFVMFVAEGRVIGRATGDNWQGTGVEPDVRVSEALALGIAHRHALERLRASASDPERVRELEALIAEFENGKHR